MVGCVRPQNEDMILVNSHFVRDDIYEAQAKLSADDRYIIAVADGMGGHHKGDVASSDTLTNLQYYYHDIPAHLSASDLNETIVGWLDGINSFITAKGRADEQYRDMGTTLVALAYYEGDFYTMNCGDSRLYRFRDGQLQQLTTDHSLNRLLGSEKHSNIITNCIGGGCGTSYIDMVQITADVASGDRFLLCSDGLTDMLPDSMITRLLASEVKAEVLCQAAVEEGGLDNVSCCVVDVIK